MKIPVPAKMHGSRSPALLFIHEAHDPGIWLHDPLSHLSRFYFLVDEQADGLEALLRSTQ
jgi:hypothetical protein